MTESSIKRFRASANMNQFLKNAYPLHRGAVYQPGYIRGLCAPWRDLAFKQPRRKWKKGESLSFITDPTLQNKFAYILEGCVYTYITFMDGSERLKLVVDDNCLLFEAYCAAGDWERDCYHFVHKDLELAIFDGALLHQEEFQRGYPHLIANAFRSASIKYILFDALIDCAYKNSALQKVAWYIFKISEMNNGSLNPKTMLSQKEIASYLCISQASMTRAVTVLKQKKIIASFRYNDVQILDLQKLETLSREIS